MTESELTTTKEARATVAEAAQDVVDELLSCGHEDITVLDLLDVLGSTGYTLVKDEAGLSSETYIAALVLNE